MDFDQANVATEEYEGRLAAALALREIGDFRSAQEQLRLAVKLKPDGDEAAVLLGLTLHDLGQLPAAERELRRACKLAPQSKEARLALGMVLLARGKPAAAARWLKPLAQDVHDTAVRNMYTLALAKTPRGLAHAIVLLEESFAHLPQDEDLAIHLAALLQQKGDHHRAAAVLEPLAETTSSPDVLRPLSRSFGELGLLDRALETARRATELAPEQIDLWLNLADQARSASKLDEAVDAASKAIELDDQSLRAWLARTMAHDDCKHWAEALGDVEHAIRLVESQKSQSDLLERLKYFRAWYVWRTRGVDAALTQVEADLVLHPDSDGLRKLQEYLLLPKQNP